MKAAINELTIALETMETNEPINRAEGNVEQAELEAANAADYRQALAVLNAASNGPIWPEPKALDLIEEKIHPLYFVKHMDDSYSEADPQP